MPQPGEIRCPPLALPRRQHVDPGSRRVQVLAWRMLNQLGDEAWARDLLDMLYLDEETESWAKAGMVKPEEPALIHKDSNGATLSAGDTVVLIKDLNVKGARLHRQTRHRRKKHIPSRR